MPDFKKGNNGYPISLLLWKLFQENRKTIESAPELLEILFFQSILTGDHNVNVLSTPVLINITIIHCLYFQKVDNFAVLLNAPSK